MEIPPEVLAAREKLKARFGNVETHIGGKGTTRRPVKTSHKASAVDEKKLQAGLKKLAVNAVPSIETVQLFKNDGSVLQFNSPKVQANPQAGLYVVSGTPETKTLEDLRRFGGLGGLGGMPGLGSGISKEDLAKMSKMTPEQMNRYMASLLPGGAGGDDDEPPALEGGKDFAAAAEEEEDDDDDGPPPLEQ